LRWVLVSSRHALSVLLKGERRGGFVGYDIPGVKTRKSFQLGHPKYGGRQKGTPNKRTLAKLARVPDYMIDNKRSPIEEVMKLVQLLEPKDAIKVWLELLQYCDAKHREVMVAADPEQSELAQKFDNVSDSVLLKLVETIEEKGS
jgi:hypothetical protein